MESAHSIRFLYRHFLSGITEKSLNAFYYACSYAKVDYSGFMNITASMTLKLIPESLRSQPAGKKGRPAKHGKLLSPDDDFTLSDEKVGEYYIGARRVLTNLFG
ncbi:MAG: hypothetical protein K2N73_09030, partial [Lachnospiraceae bacterium]|nr:hypothetical protein [Lachnospiraceae bacterium]